MTGFMSHLATHLPNARLRADGARLAAVTSASGAVAGEAPPCPSEGAFGRPPSSVKERNSGRGLCSIRVSHRGQRLSSLYAMPP